MGLKGSVREYEIKYTCADSYKSACKLIQAHFKPIKVEKGESSDFYWKAVNKKTADFIRLRYHGPVSGEITVKHTDKNGIHDRFEIDVPVLSPEHAKKLLTRYLGKSMGEVTKKYEVFFLDSKDTNISVYRVKADGTLFVEIESYNLANVKAISKKLSTILKIKEVKKSLFDLYIK